METECKYHVDHENRIKKLEAYMDEARNEHKKQSVTVAVIGLIGAVFTAVMSFFGVVFTAFLQSKGLF